jgi:hypothetical protein
MATTHHSFYFWKPAEKIFCGGGYFITESLQKLCITLMMVPPKHLRIITGMYENVLK